MKSNAIKIEIDGQSIIFEKSELARLVRINKINYAFAPGEVVSPDIFEVLSMAEMIPAPLAPSTLFENRVQPWIS